MCPGAKVGKSGVGARETTGNSHYPRGGATQAHRDDAIASTVVVEGVAEDAQPDGLAQRPERLRCLRRHGHAAVLAHEPVDISGTDEVGLVPHEEARLLREPQVVE